MNAPTAPPTRTTLRLRLLAGIAWLGGRSGRPALIVLWCLIGVAVGGYSLYRHQALEVRTRAVAHLTDATDLMAGQLERWLADRRSGLEHVGSNDLLARGLRSAQRGVGGPAALDTLGVTLDLLRSTREFERLQVFAPDGEPLVASGGTIPMTEALRRWARGATATGRVVVSDLYVPADAVDRKAVVDFVVTISRAGDPEPAAVLVARADPERFLFPALKFGNRHKLQTSYSIARRDGDEVALLLANWHGATRTATFEYETVGRETAAAQVVAGRLGVFEAPDYRGVPMLATGRVVTGTPWYLVAKVARDEVYAPLERTARLATLLGLVGLATVALLIAVWWQSERLAFSEKLDAAERRARRLQQRFALAGRLVHDLMLLVEARTGRILEVNDRALVAYGYSREEMLARTFHDLHPSGSQEADAAAAHFAGTVASGSGAFGARHSRKDGSTFPVEVSARTLEIDGHAYVQVIGRDVSERIEHERRLAALATDRDYAFERLQLQFDRMPSACIVLSVDFRTLQVNPAFERVFGLRASDVTGRPVVDFIKLPRFREETLTRLAQLREAPDTSYTGVHENLTAQGRAIICRWHAAALRSHDGSVHGFVVMADDITELVQAERALRLSDGRYRALTDVSPVGIFRTDLAGHTVFVNPRACAIAGLDAQAALTLGWARALHPDDAADVATQWRRYVESGGRAAGALEFRMVRPDGATAWVFAQMTPERDGEGRLVGHVGTITDITAVKQTQLELQHAHDQLEQRVRERTAELEAAKNAAERSDRVKTAFLSTMSHELRTPLNSILGFTDLLLLGLPGPLTGEQERQLLIVRDSSMHLRDLVEDVLDISRIEAGQVGLEYGDVDLRALLARRVDSFETLAVRKGIALRLEPTGEAPVIRSDARRVAQIVGNLVSNAVKFTDAGDVAVALRTVGGRIEITVSDTGVGIPAAALGQIFNPFVQVTRPGGKLRDGAGLGLAISRNLARALGGDVTVDSEPGRGSHFTLWLPAVVAVAA